MHLYVSIDILSIICNSRFIVLLGNSVYTDMWECIGGCHLGKMEEGNIHVLYMVSLLDPFLFQ